MQIKLNEVIDALDMTSASKQFYYYIPEERIISSDDFDDEDINSKDLLALPSHKEKDDYSIMESFIESLPESQGKEWLVEAIKGPGAFKRFRNTAERFDLLDDWYEYRDNVYENIAIEWCNYYGVEYLDDNPYHVEDKPEQKPVKVKSVEHNYRLININEDNIYGLVYLVKDFRKVLAKFKNLESEVDVDEALEELQYYIQKSYPIYAISDNGKYIAYCVCKIEDDVVWLESIYVLPQERKKGVGKLLLDKAEEVAREYHNDTLYFYVHPNNHEMLNFLKSNGYDVLNLIEIRKKYQDENLDTTYTIGDHEYKY